MLKTLLLLIPALLIFLLLGGCANLASSSNDSYDPKLDTYNASQLLVLGEKAIAANNQRDAVKYLRALDVRYPFSSYTRQGMLDIIYAYYDRNSIASALAAADRYIRVYPRGANVDYAYYMRGLLNMGRGRSWLYRKLHVDPSERDLTYVRQAFFDFTRLVQLFPHSQYTADAYYRLLYLRNVLARYELNIAKYYLTRRAYVGAANRATSVIEHYEGSPQVEDALVVLVKAYRRLKEPRLEANALRVLRLNYPNNAFLLGKERSKSKLASMFEF